MSLIGFLLLLLIAAIAGSIGMSLAGFSRGGCLASLIVGFVGAWVGTWLAGALGLPEIFAVNIEGRVFPVVWAVVGAFIVSLILGAIFRRRRRRIYL